MALDTEGNLKHYSKPLELVQYRELGMNSYIQLIPERGASSLGDLKDDMPNLQSPTKEEVLVKVSHWAGQEGFKLERPMMFKGLR